MNKRPLKPITMLVAIVISWLMVTSAIAQTPQMFSRQWHHDAARFQSERYDVVTDLEPDAAETFAKHMDVVYDAYAEFFDFLRVRKKLRFELYLFKDEPEYLQVLDAEFDADARGTGGMNVTEGSRNTLAVWLGGRGDEHVRQVLQHEGFHQFAAALFSDMPHWLNEGLAEVFELALFVDGSTILGEVPESRITQLQVRLKQNKLLGFEYMINIDGDDWLDHVNAGTGEGSLQYMQAWSMVHFLIYGDNARHQDAFQSILRQLNDGRSWESAYMNAFGTNQYSEFELAWRRNLAQTKPTDMKTTIRRLDFLAAGLKALNTEGIRPDSLDVLRQELVHRKFRHRSELFDSVEILDASDEKLYRIPSSPRQVDPAHMPTFTVHDGVELQQRRGGYTAKRRAGKDVPQIVSTEGLQPRQFGFGWVREKNGELRRIIVAH